MAGRHCTDIIGWTAVSCWPKNIYIIQLKQHGTRPVEPTSRSRGDLKSPFNKTIIAGLQAETKQLKSHRFVGATKHINILITKHRTQCNTPLVGHPCPPVALVKSYQRRALFCFLFFDMGSQQKTITRSLPEVVARFDPVTFFSVKPFSCHFFWSRENQVPKKVRKTTNAPCPPMHRIFSRLKRYD